MHTLRQGPGACLIESPHKPRLRLTHLLSSSYRRQNDLEGYYDIQALSLTNPPASRTGTITLPAMVHMKLLLILHIVSKITTGKEGGGRSERSVPGHKRTSHGPSPTSRMTCGLSSTYSSPVIVKGQTPQLLL